MSRAALLLALGGLACAGALAGEPAGVRDATADLYARMSASDLAGVSRYLPAEGFTELSEGAAAPHRLGAAAFAGLFKSGAHVALHVTDVQVQGFADTAIVTGVRVGSITTPGANGVEMSAPFTMVWTQDAGQWHLRHVHLSTPVPSH
jgi:ketosteroid isomerase-like protein